MSLFYILLFLTCAYGRVAVIEDDLNIISNSSKVLEQDDVTDDVVTVITPSEGACNTTASDDNNEPCSDTTKIDNGTALILTPFIEQGLIEEARNASRVDPQLFLGIESYSGFLTVNSTYNSNLFFWYFPSFAKPVSETPWLIWLQGGPGASSLVALFEEFGPFTIPSKQKNETLKLNPYTWLVNHSLVFIDNPVGSGYSFTDHEAGYVQDMDTYGKHLYTAVKQLVQVFPELRVAPLFVAGESYAGKYVPALSMQIHRHNHAPGTDINFKGLMMGNAFMEPAQIMTPSDTYYSLGMLEKEQVEAIQPLVDLYRADIAANRSVVVKKEWTQLVSLLLSMSYLRHGYNFLSNSLNIDNFVPFLTRPEVKKALHVGDIRYSVINVTVNDKLAPDFLSNSSYLVEELLENYKVLVYCGHMDQMLPCAATGERLRHWRWSGHEQFNKSMRAPYRYDNQLAGYVKTGGNLTWVVVRGAGHMVPSDRPAAAQHMVAQWTHGQQLYKMSSMMAFFHPMFVRDNVNKFVKNVLEKREENTTQTIDAKHETSQNVTAANVDAKVNDVNDNLIVNQTSENVIPDSLAQDIVVYM